MWKIEDNLQKAVLRYFLQSQSQRQQKNAQHHTTNKRWS